MILFLEKYGPILAAAMAIAALLFFKDEVVARCASKDINFGSLYSAVLDWSAIQTGFLFGIFGFVAGKNDGFVAAVRETEEMRRFSRYMKTAIFLGFTVTFFSIPLMVVNFSIESGSSIRYGIFLAWSLLSIWSFFSFARVAYIFGILVRPKEREQYPG